MQFIADFGAERGKIRPPVVLLPHYDTIMEKALQILKPKGGKTVAQDYVLALMEPNSSGSREVIRTDDGAAIVLGRGPLYDGAVIALTTERPAFHQGSAPAGPRRVVCVVCSGSCLLLRDPCPLCDGTGSFSDDEGSGWAELPPLIRGKGRHEGRPPRAAGIIAICNLRGEPHVCLCEKKNGKKSFPKGGLGGDTVLDGAKREWSEEAGLSLSRLRLLRGTSLDEPAIGARYLLAQCNPSDPSSGEPDAGRKEWAPPHEDPKDPDPIVKSQWLPVRQVLRRRANLKESRCHLLEQAIAQLEGECNFEPA